MTVANAIRRGALVRVGAGACTVNQAQLPRSPPSSCRQSLSNTTQTSAFLARQMSEFPQLLRMWTSTTAGAVIAATNVINSRPHNTPCMRPPSSHPTCHNKQSTAYLSEQRSGEACLIGYVPAGDGNRGAQSSVQCPFTASEQPWYTVALGHPSGPAWTALRHDAGLGHTIMSLAILVNDTAGASSGPPMLALSSHHKPPPFPHRLWHGHRGGRH